jgi:hypothetical protein
MAPERTGALAGFPVGLILSGRPRGRLADSLDGVVCTKAELVGPALGEDPLAVPRAMVARTGEVGEHHGGDSMVAVEAMAREPGHLPQVRPPGHQAGAVSGAVAAHAVVEDGHRHGLAADAWWNAPVVCA